MQNRPWAYWDLPPFISWGLRQVWRPVFSPLHSTGSRSLKLACYNLLRQWGAAAHHFRINDQMEAGCSVFCLQLQAVNRFYYNYFNCKSSEGNLKEMCRFANQNHTVAHNKGQWSLLKASFSEPGVILITIQIINLLFGGICLHEPQMSVHYNFAKGKKYSPSYCQGSNTFWSSCFVLLVYVHNCVSLFSRVFMCECMSVCMCLFLGLCLCVYECIHIA